MILQTWWKLDIKKEAQLNLNILNYILPKPRQKWSQREREKVTMDPIRKRQKGKLRNPERRIWWDPQI